MNNPYALGSAALPARSPRRAPYSAAAAVLLCLFMGLALFAFANANSSTMSHIGMFRPVSPSPQIERLRLLWDIANNSLLVCPVVCILLGAVRLSTERIQWLRRAVIWTVVAAMWGLVEFTIYMTHPFLAAAANRA